MIKYIPRVDSKKNLFLPATYSIPSLSVSLIPPPTYQQRQTTI